jgi:DNA-binding NarL/FixJ family response regulator
MTIPYPTICAYRVALKTQVGYYIDRRNTQVVHHNEREQVMKRNTKGQFVKISTAERIRRLHAKGIETKQIARELNVRYQIVRNTLVRQGTQTA